MLPVGAMRRMEERGEVPPVRSATPAETALEDIKGRIDVVGNELATTRAEAEHHEREARLLRHREAILQAEYDALSNIVVTEKSRDMDDLPF